MLIVVKKYASAKIRFALHTGGLQRSQPHQFTVGCLARSFATKTLAQVREEALRLLRELHEGLVRSEPLSMTASRQPRRHRQYGSRVRRRQVARSTPGSLVARSLVSIRSPKPKLLPAWSWPSFTTDCSGEYIFIIGDSKVAVKM